MEDAWLKARLAQSEDQWTERKESFNESDVRRTLVAFANSLPANGEPAVLFLGAANNGKHPGLTDADGLQKKVRPQAEMHSYPSITVNMKVISVPVEGSEKEILAVIVPPSTNRPHFAGSAFVRSGSETLRASEAIFKELIASQNDKARRLLQWRGKRILLHTRSQPTGFYIEYQNAVIRSVDAHSLTIDSGEGGGQTYSTESADVHHLYGDILRVVVPFQGTEQQLIQEMISRWLFNQGDYQGSALPGGPLRYLADQLLDNIRVSWDMINLRLMDSSFPAGLALRNYAIARAQSAGLVAKPASFFIKNI